MQENNKNNRLHSSSQPELRLDLLFFCSLRNYYTFCLYITNVGHSCAVPSVSIAAT